MPAEKPTRLRLPSPDARVARSPFQGATDLFTEGGAASTSIFTITINILNTEFVTIDGKVYTWLTVLVPGDGNVLIGATASDSLDNLVAAINLDPAGSGTLYAANTTLHPTVSAAAGAGLTVDVTAKFRGTAGDAITTTEDIVSGGAAWTGATLAGGADPDPEVRFVPVVQWGKIRTRTLLNGSDGALTMEFVRPAREKEPNTDGTAYVYVLGQPAATGPTALVDGTELVQDITAAEHSGENWLKLTLEVENSDAFTFLDISGELLGLYH